MRKKTIAIFLAIALVAMLLPTFALAADVITEPGPQVKSTSSVFYFNADACSVYVTVDGSGYGSVSPGDTVYASVDSKVDVSVALNSGYAFSSATVNGAAQDGQDFTFYPESDSNEVDIYTTNNKPDSIEVNFSFDDQACSVQYQNNTMTWYTASDGQEISVASGTALSVKVAAYNGYTYNYTRVGGQTYTDSNFSTDILNSDTNVYVVTARSSGTAPYISNYPASHSIKVGGSTSMSVTAGGTEPLSYQWQMYSGNVWTNLYDGVSGGCAYSGAKTATLYVTGESAGTYTYRCKVDNDYGEAISGNASLTVAAPTPTGNPFVDIVPTAWYYNDVVKAYDKGLIAGTSANTFSPNNNITYGEVIKLAACLHQMSETGSVTLVGGAGPVWYQPYMSYAVDNGIIASDYSSVQANLCDRQDFVDIFYSAMPASTYNAVNNVTRIPDYPNNGSLEAQHVYTFYNAGITVGSDGYQFKANTYITRAEVATIITRMYDSTARVTGLVLN